MIQEEDIQNFNEMNPEQQAAMVQALQQQKMMQVGVDQQNDD